MPPAGLWIGPILLLSVPDAGSSDHGHSFLRSEIMNRALLFTMLGLSWSLSGWAQTADFYENVGIVVCPPDVPPQVDAFSFVNAGAFTVDFTNLSVNTTLFSTA